MFRNKKILILIIGVILATAANFVLAVEPTAQEVQKSAATSVVSLVVLNPPVPDAPVNAGTASLLTVIMNTLFSGMGKVLLVISIIIIVLGLGVFYFFRKFKIIKKVA